MIKGLTAFVSALGLIVLSGNGAVAQTAGVPILSGPLVKLDIKPAQIATKHGTPKGTLTVAQHFGLDPGWVNPQTHSYVLTQVQYDYFLHDALIKSMPQGVLTYSLAEHAELSADFKRAAFRLRAGLKFQDGTPLTTEDVKWTYEHFKGAYASIFHSKLDNIKIVDDRTIIFNFKEPFLDFMDLYNGGVSGIGWVVPHKYYEKVGDDGFKAHPVGAGPFKFVSQQAGSQFVFEAWNDYWRRTPGVEKVVVKGIRDPASRLAGLQTGELDLAYGMTGKLLPRVMADKNLRWDKNFTGPWYLLFPGYNDKDSPFHDKRVREAVSLSINRQFLSKRETQGIGIPWGNWINHGNPDALKGDGTALPVPEYDPAKAKKLLAEAGYPNGFDFEWYVPFVPYFQMGERVLVDLRAVGIRGKLEVLEGPAFRAKMGRGRSGYPGNKTIVQNIDPRPGGAAASIRVFAVCGSKSSFICEPEIEKLWKKREASVDPEIRNEVLEKIQHYIVENYLTVPIYLNPFVHAVGPRVLPAGDKEFHHYWDTMNAPYPWPWEDWEVKADK